MSSQRRPSRAVLLAAIGLVVLGIGLRVLLYHLRNDDEADLANEQAVVLALLHHFFHAYQATRPVAGAAGPAWTYPAGLFPVLVAAHVLTHTGVDYRVWITLFNLIADIGVAGAVFVHLRSRRGDVRALVGGGLVMLSWPILFDTGFMSQVDSMTVVVAVAAVLAWNHDGARRYLWAGLLLGLATSFKLPFVFLIFAMLPSARGARERIQLLVLVAAVPLIVTGPFLLADFSSVHHAISSNQGLTGIAGWTLLIEPALRHIWLDHQGVPVNSAVSSLSAHQSAIVLVVLLVVGAVLWRLKAAPVPAAAVVVLALWLGNVNPNLTYLVWVIPFLLLDDRIVAAVGVQLVSLAPGLMFFVYNPYPRAEWLYVPCIALLEATMLFVLCRLLHDAWRAAGRPALLGRVSREHALEHSVE